jgi:hypothetical protein
MFLFVRFYLIRQILDAPFRCAWRPADPAATQSRNNALHFPVTWSATLNPTQIGHAAAEMVGCG